MGNAESAAQYYVEYASKRREENEAKEAKEVVEKTGLGMHTDIFSYNLRPTPIERVLNTKQTFSNSHYLVKEGRLFKRSGIRTVSLHISTQFPDCPELFGKMFVMIYTDSKTDNEDIPPIYVHCMGLPFAEVSKNINHHVKTIYAQGRTCMVCMVTKPAEMHKRCANETKVTKRILEEEKGIKKSWNMSWFDSADIEKENMRHVIVSPSTIKVEHSVSVYPTEGYGKRAVTNTVFAWASLVCGITNKPISGVPIIWRKSQGSMHTIRPILRERKHGDANDENLSMFDYSEASTSKSVILSCKFSGGNSALTTDSNIARYNALKSAPMPYEGVISVPVERSDQTRRMRLVDVMICHPMIQGWVNNCTVSVKYTSGKYTVLERNAVVEADKTTLVVSRCYEEPLTKQPIPDLSKKLKRMSIQDLENPFGYTHNEEEQEEEDEDPLLFNRRTKRVVPEKLPTKESLSELLHQGTPTEEEQRDEGEDIKDVKPPIIPIYAIESTSDECASTNSTTDVDDITSSPSFTESSSSMEEDWSSTALADEPRMRKHLNRSSIRMKSAMRDIGQIPLSSETETTPAKKPKKKKKLRLGLKKLNNSEKDRKGTQVVIYVYTDVLTLFVFFLAAMVDRLPSIIGTLTSDRIYTQSKQTVPGRRRNTIERDLKRGHHRGSILLSVQKSPGFRRSPPTRPAAGFSRRT